ncbi:MAG TPA: ATP-binding protein [Solirubrobacterales bacterium]|jgi:anti-sigma regulatory factor (Ser/Thr protein kinase)
MSGTVSISLPLEPESAARARASVEELRDGMSSDAYTDLRLLVSELVVDAVQTHTAEDASEIEMRAELQDGAVWVKLSQGSSAYNLRPRLPEPGEPGWGLHLVARLARRWGLRREPGRSSVWWEMARDQVRR